MGDLIARAMANRASGISLGNLTNGDIVQLIDTTPPLDIDVTKILVSNIGINGLTLNWSQSSSLDVSLYEIYEGVTLLGSVTPSYSIFQTMLFNITGLSPNTTHTYTIKVKDNGDNRSNGVNVTTKTLGNQAISMNGTTDFLKLPLLTFTTIEMKFSLNLPVPVVTNISIIDARNGIATGYYERSTNNSDNAGASWSSIYINGTLKMATIIPNASITVLQLNLAVSGTDDVNIFSNSLGNQRATGTIYYVKLFNNGNIVAYYDFTTQFAGSSVTDISGNGNPSATLTGGTWITP